MSRMAASPAFHTPALKGVATDHKALLHSPLSCFSFPSHPPLNVLEQATIKQCVVGPNHAAFLLEVSYGAWRPGRGREMATPDPMHQDLLLSAQLWQAAVSFERYFSNHVVPCTCGINSLPKEHLSDLLELETA